jgi:uncharacterized OB-fold protein
MRRNMMGTPQKPVPIINPWARPFWEEAHQRKLAFQRCEDCGKNVFYPRIACPHCFSDRLMWVESSGKGTIYSYTVVENNAPSAFIEDMPFVIAIVKLEEEGVQMLTNIVGCDPAEVRCDMKVQVTFEKLTDEVTLPKFKPVES